MPKKKDEDILFSDVTKAEVRKAYFKGALAKLLNKIQEDYSVTEKDTDALETYLKEIRGEDETFLNRLLDTFGGKVIGVEEQVTPPTVEELYKEREENPEFKEWKQKADYAVNHAKTTMQNVAKSTIGNIAIKKSDFLNYAHTMTGLMGFISEWETYCEQLWYKRLTEIIDKTGVSRAEAENRSKLTMEYRDYKNAKRLLEQCDNFIMNCKKENADKFN